MTEESLSAEGMAQLLFALTVGTQDENGQRLLKDEINQISAGAVDPDVVQLELAFLKLSAVDIALFRYEDLRVLHGPKLDEVQIGYISHFRERGEITGPHAEEAFLHVCETRLAAYNKAFDAWLEAHNNRRGHEQTFAIGEIFFNFCGVPNANPVSIFLIGHKFRTILFAVNERLRSCKLT